jgi:hypothetical protein
MRHFFYLRAAKAPGLSEKWTVSLAGSKIGEGTHAQE